jgi:hypothetical protein
MNLKMLKIPFTGLILSVSCFANASLITHEFNNGDSLSDWSVDRSSPAGFEIITDELVMSVSGPSNTVDDSKNTQGMKLDIDLSTYISIDMYIDSAWSNDERYGGIWAQSIDIFGVTSGWPVIEYKGTEGVQAWDNSGWQTPSVDFNFDEFNTFTFEITNSGVEYSLNDTLFYTDSLSNTSYFTSVLLNAKYEGTDFDVRYDNLTYNVPEPSTIAILTLGIMGFASRRFKK